MWMIFPLYQSLVAILFPPACFGCRQPGTPLCSPCVKKARKTIATLPPYTTSLYSYQDPLIKKSLHAIKYFHRKDLLLPLIDTLADYIRSEDITFSKKTILIPIPMPRIRKLIRGYNQAELIASILSQHLGLAVNTSILKRIKSPSRQVTMKNKSTRLQNQKHSFAINKTVTYDLSSLDIMLVDDVTTTGATLAEARNVLLASGARTVRAITLAH